MSHWHDLLRKPLGNMRIFIRILIRILHVVRSAGLQIHIIPVAVFVNHDTDLSNAAAHLLKLWIGPNQ